MDFYSLVIIAIALSLDAFGVAISIGINKGVKRNSKLIFAASFGFFQFFFTLLGAYAGFLFNTYVVAIPKIIGGVIIALVGVLMIKEGFEEKEDNIFSSFKMYIILGISVSIDAAVVGFTVFNKINSNYIIAAQSIFVGIVTFIISVLAFIISKYLRKLELVTKYADYVGGVILILFGLKMMFF